MLTYKVEPNTLELANKMEFLRLSAYGFTPTKEDYDQSYINEIISGRILVITCYYNNTHVQVVSYSYEEEYIYANGCDKE